MVYMYTHVCAGMHVSLCVCVSICVCFMCVLGLELRALAQALHH